jgi:hypothetical protein
VNKSQVPPNVALRVVVVVVVIEIVEVSRGEGREGTLKTRI